MATCSMNSTDCLLQELVDNTSGYNWNPLNFAFTAILSILALCLALATLFQALYASGPGRMKASEAAIGHYYSRTARTKFNTTEWRFRTTVKVPNIELSTIIAGKPLLDASRQRPLRLLKRLSTRRTVFPFGHTNTAQCQHYNKWFVWSKRSLLRLCNPRRLSEQNDVESVSLREDNSDNDHTEDSAGDSAWSRLLADTGSEDLPFQTTVCKSDFLPDEIRAAPAYASLEALLFLALAAGCTSYGMGSGYLEAIGPNVQLNIREHLILGEVGFYRRHNVSNKSLLSAVLPRRTRLLCCQGLGMIHYRRKPLLTFEFMQRSASSVTVRGALSNGELLRGIESSSLGCNHDRCFRRNKLMPSWYSFFQQNRGHEISVLTGFLFGDKPDFVSMFPSGGVHQLEQLRLVARRNPFWKAGQIDILHALQWAVPQNAQIIAFDVESDGCHISISSKIGTGLKKHHLVQVDHNLTPEEIFPLGNEHTAYTSGTSWLDDQKLPLARPKDGELHLHRNTNIDGRIPARPQRMQAAPNDLIISLEALQLTLQWLDENPKLSEAHRERTLRMLSYQLEEIDWYLGRRGGQKALCAALFLLADTQDLLPRRITDGREKRGRRTRTGSRREPSQAQLRPDRGRSLPPWSRSPSSRMQQQSHHLQVVYYDSRNLVESPSRDSEIDDDLIENMQLVPHIRTLPIQHIRRQPLQIGWHDEPDILSIENGLSRGRRAIRPERQAARHTARRERESEWESNLHENHAPAVGRHPKRVHKGPTRVSPSRSRERSRPNIDYTGTLPAAPLPRSRERRRPSRSNTFRATPDDNIGLDRNGIRRYDTGTIELPQDTGPRLRVESPIRMADLIGAEHRLEGMEALLIYRACLYGTLMSLVVDTSEMLSSKRRNKIVQVL